jgi:SAM-dependent methyltransferase
MGRKQPKLVLRESAVHDMSASWPPGSFLEMGAGTGHMTRVFVERGFYGACYDLGADSRELMRRNLADVSRQVRVVDDAAQLDAGSFDYLLAFEVLEHIDDDGAALREWLTYLRPGGRVLLTVPAHARKFGRSDELVGHLRRYEKAQLSALLVGAGIERISIVNYGFPLTELTRRLSNRLVQNDRSYDKMTPEQRSIRSAQTRPRIIDRALSLTGSRAFIPFCTVQRWFYRWDLGDGYVASGVKGVA